MNKKGNNFNNQGLFIGLPSSNAVLLCLNVSHAYCGTEYGTVAIEKSYLIEKFKIPPLVGYMMGAVSCL